MKYIFQFIVKKPSFVMVFIVAIFLSAASGLKSFKLDASSDALVIEGDEAFKVYRETGEIFGNSDFLIITFTPEFDLFSSQSLATIKSLDTQLNQLPGVQSVLTILDAPIFFQPKGALADLMSNLKTLESEDIDFAAAKEEILNNPVYSELIISPSGNTTAIQVTLEENSLYRNLIRKRYELLEFSNLSLSQKNELNNIANGIASCDPIIIGETIPASFKDNVIKTFAKKPIDTEKQKRGNQYFLSGILNFQKGIKQMKTTSILKLPINRGGTFSLKITF